MNKHDPLPETEIGTAASGGNFVLYTRAATRRVSAPDAPILVVEDDEGTRRLLERVLTLEGFPVRTAAHSGEFAEALRTPPLPRLVLLDFELPSVNGLRLLALLRQQALTRAIPVIMVTGHTESQHIQQAMALGADGYLSKPLSVATLRAVVARMLSR